MTTLSVPPGCSGVEFPNGGQLNADKRGHVHVDDPSVARWALGTVHAKNGALAVTATSFRVGASRFCVSCGHEGFGWQQVCPKCGDEMSEE